jgi:hypothetical protein
MLPDEVLKTSSAACADPPQYEAAQHLGSSVSSCGKSRYISAGYVSRPRLRRAKPLKQLLAIMLVFIVLTLGRGMAPRCAVA